MFTINHKWNGLSHSLSRLIKYWLVDSKIINPRVVIGTIVTEMRTTRTNPLGTPCICTKELHNNWPPIHSKLMKEGEYIFPGTDQLCSGMFHIMKCSEADIDLHHCLRDNSWDCRHRNVTLIVRHFLDDGDEKLYRYTFCKTNYRTPIHAEEFMIIDKRLLVPGSRILVYSYLQPCHHSGGSNADEYDKRSCTELLLQWENDVLHPIGITLEIRIATLYKAAWEGVRDYLPDYNRFDKTSDLARLGVSLILSSRITLTIMKSEDYQYIADRIPGTVRLESMSEEYMDARVKSDNLIIKVLDRLGPSD